MKFYELFVGFRYLKSKKSQGFISFNTLLSMGIVFFGVLILIVVTSVMNGFQVQIKDKILDVDSHISVTNMYGELDGRGVVAYRDMARTIRGIKGVRSVDPYIDGQGLLRYRENITYVMIRGIGDDGAVPHNLEKFMVEGAERVRARGIYIGHEMARLYNIEQNDVLEIIVPKGRLTAREGVAPGLGRYPVLGFFKTGYYDYDTKLILMSLGAAQRLFEVGDIALGLGVRIDDVYSMNMIASKIQSLIGFQYSARTAEEKNHNLFYALRLEKLIMTIILFLVIVSAGFTIMGTLAMVVMEKRKAVGILKSMGARPTSIMVIFILEGFLIGVIGALSGLVVGLAAAINLESIILWIERTLNQFMSWLYHALNLGPFYKITIVPTSVYYIDSIPTEVEIGFVTFIVIFAVFLSTVAAIFPAWQASRLRPVETMRYE
jgi:lipoprotein-releasing system permease protein